MSHIDDGQLNALLDGELSLEEARAVEAHVAGCDACRRRLEEARRFLTEASELLSAVVPPAQRFVTPRPTPSGLRTSTPAVAPPPAGTPVAGPPAPPDAAPATTPAAADAAGADAPGTPTRRVTKTAKEVAIDIDGATGKSPAIRLFPQQQERLGTAERPAMAEPAARPRRFPARQLALAATIVLTFAVGYAANDLMQSRDAPPSAELAFRTDSSAGPLAAQDERSRQAPAGPAAANRSRTTRSVTPAATPSRAAEQAGNLRRDAAPLGASSAADQRDLAGAGAPATSSRQDDPPLRAPRTTPRREPPRPADVAAAPSTVRRAQTAPAGRTPAAPALAQGDTVSRDDLSRMRAAEAANAAPAPAPVVAPRTFRRTTLDTAVVRLSGSIRLIDGMDPSRVEIGPGRLVNGAAAGQDVVRIHYTDERGRRFVFDQQRLAPARGDAAAGAGAGAGEVGLLSCDTIVTTSGTTTRVRWLDSKNFWMSLSGPLPADSLRALVARVR
jgi:hypothetical protein